MENRPIIKKEQVETVYDSRFIKVFDLQYEPGKHYFDATRRAKDNLAAVKSDEEFRQMLPDAVSCVVILKTRRMQRKKIPYSMRQPGSFGKRPASHWKRATASVW